MKCRRLKEENNHQNIIWFGSHGVDEFGHAIFDGFEDKRYVNLTYKLPYDGFLPETGNYDVFYTNDDGETGYIWTKNGYVNVEDISDEVVKITTTDELKAYLNNINRNKLSYSERQHGVRDSLIQRLSVLKGELWYKASYGLPLLEKTRNKGIYDAIISDIILSHPDVTNLVDFSSKIDNHKYVFDFTVITTYTDESIKINLGIDY